MNDPYMLVGNGFDVTAMPVHPGGAGMARIASGLKPRPGAPMPYTLTPAPPKPELCRRLAASLQTAPRLT